MQLLIVAPSAVAARIFTTKFQDHYVILLIEFHYWVTVQLGMQLLVITRRTNASRHRALHYVIFIINLFKLGCSTRVSSATLGKCL